MYYFIDKLREVKNLQEIIAEKTPTDENRLLLALSDAVTALAEGMAIVIAENEKSLDTVNMPDMTIVDFDNKGYLCPNCNSSIHIEDSIIEDGDYIICPKCGGPILIATNEPQC